MIKKCIVCNREFEAKGNNAKFCSEKCRNVKIPTNDHVGEQRYELKIKAAYYQKSKLYVECECSCGKTKTIRYDSLLNGNTQSCGHVGKKNLLKPVDLVGKINKYGVKALYVIGKKDKTYVWHCVCACGKEFNTTAEVFYKIKSCGCAQDLARKEHAKGILKEKRDNAKCDGTNIYSINNKTLFKNNTSGVRGVVWDKSRKKWRAQITFKGKNYYLGRYSKKEEAIAARKKAEKKMFEEFLKEFAKKFPDRWDKI